MSKDEKTIAEKNINTQNRDISELETRKKGLVELEDAYIEFFDHASTSQAEKSAEKSTETPPKKAASNQHPPAQKPEAKTSSHGNPTMGPQVHSPNIMEPSNPSVEVIPKERRASASAERKVQEITGDGGSTSGDAVSPSPSPRHRPLSESPNLNQATHIDSDRAPLSHAKREASYAPHAPSRDLSLPTRVAYFLRDLPHRLEGIEKLFYAFIVCVVFFVWVLLDRGFRPRVNPELKEINRLLIHALESDAEDNYSESIQQLIRASVLIKDDAQREQILKLIEQRTQNQGKPGLKNARKPRR